MSTLPGDAPSPNKIPLEDGRDESHHDTACGAETNLGHASHHPTVEELARKDDGRAPESTAFVSFDLPPDIPNYKIRTILGQGGMGIVYRAEQTQLSRSVAIKMLATPGKPSEEQLTRFHAEAAALARLRHPNIVEIYDYGEWNGRPYFVMELIEGRSLAELAAGKPLAPVFAARLIMIVAQAVQAVHEKGILHRDLKPGNVLLQNLSNDDPDRSIDLSHSVSFGGRTYVPKITDFGVAKDLLALQKITRTGTTVGTPQYMAPEQAESEYRAIGPATDVYGLGASLYELLTGVPPIRGATPLEILVQIPTHEPAAPGVLQPGIPRDLDLICGKCLEKLPTRRYASAQALADDLQAFLEGRPIKARPTGSVTRTVRWCRRRPLVAAFAGLSALLTLVLIASMMVYNGRLGVALTDARQSAEESGERLVQLYTLSGMRDVEEGLALSGMVWFAEALKHDLGHAAAERRHRIRLGTTSRQAPELRELWSGTEPVSAVAVDPSGKWVILAAEAGKVQIWNLETGQKTGSDTFFDRPLISLAISDDEQWIAGIDTAGNVRLWKPREGKASETVLKQDKPFDQVAFQSGSRRLILHQSDATLRVWNLAGATWQQISDWPASRVEFSVTSPDGTHAATIVRREAQQPHGAAESKYVARVWELEKGPRDAREIALAGEVLRVALSRRGKTLAIISRVRGPEDAQILPRTWIVDSATGKTIRGILPHPRPVLGFVFDPTGRRLLTSSADHRGRIWDTATGNLLGVALIHRSDDVKVAFSSNGRYIATGGIDNQARVWNLPLEQARTPPLPHQGTVRFIAFGLDNTCLITADESTLRVWKMREPSVPEDFTLPYSPADLNALQSRDGQFRLAIEGATAQVIESETGQPIGLPLAHASRILYAVFSPTGELVATTSDDNTARIWKTRTGEMLTAPLQHDGDVLFAAFSPDGTEIVTTSEDRTARLWDVATGEPLSPPWVHDDRVVAAEFRPDRNQVLTRELSGQTFQWDISPDMRPFETIQLWAQVMSGSRFVKDRGVVPIGADGLAQAWTAYQTRAQPRARP